MSQQRLSPLLALVMALVLSGPVRPVAQPLVGAQQEPGNCQTFVATGQAVCGGFLTYWQEHGGVRQHGYPISSEFNELSEVDGKAYRVQYFERSRFESHPENQPAAAVLLSLLGSKFYKQKYPNGAAEEQTNNSSGSLYFPQTGKRLGGRFLAYWTNNGGLMQQGYPISEEFQEQNTLDGKTYSVQYFERAVFEYHPENRAPYDVLLSQLGTFQFKSKHEPPVPTATPDAYASLRQRPFTAPTVSPGSVCPVTQGQVLALPAPAYPSSAPALGSGPVYLIAADVNGGGVINPDGVARALSQSGSYHVKGPWINKPAYPGPILIRGRQLDGANKVGFEYAQYYSQPQEEMRLDEANNNGTNYGWSFWPSAVVFPSLGCYGLRIDGLNFTEVVILKVVSQP